MDRSALAWVEHQLAPRMCTSAELLYDHMASQSDESLALIYQPFDVDNPAHWSDRGSLFDYLCTTGGGRILDLGPGDGWPALILAPFLDEVVGVEGRSAAWRCAGRTHAGWASRMRALSTSSRGRPCLLTTRALTG
ncbi:MAG: hypothetical protein JXA09_00550 [Anaerolineae bacterium]|nr:hypothetical protein [Anaerolineae bacterium]